MTNIRCPHCGYEWQTKSKLMFVGCPNCTLKFRRDPNIINNEERDDTK